MKMSSRVEFHASSVKMVLLMGFSAFTTLLTSRDLLITTWSPLVVSKVVELMAGVFVDVVVVVVVGWFGLMLLVMVVAVVVWFGLLLSLLLLLVVFVVVEGIVEAMLLLLVLLVCLVWLVVVLKS